MALTCVKQRMVYDFGGKKLPRPQNIGNVFSREKTAKTPEHWECFQQRNVNKTPEHRECFQQRKNCQDPRTSGMFSAEKNSQDSRTSGMISFQQEHFNETISSFHSPPLIRLDEVELHKFRTNGNVLFGSGGKSHSVLVVLTYYQAVDACIQNVTPIESALVGKVFVEL